MAGLPHDLIDGAVLSGHSIIQHQMLPVVSRQPIKESPFKAILVWILGKSPCPQHQLLMEGSYAFLTQEPYLSVPSNGLLGRRSCDKHAE